VSPWLTFGILIAALLAIPSFGAAQVVVKVSDDVNFRLGTLIQGWGDWTQDPIGGGYAQNFFLRRVRIIVAGTIARDVSFFFQTDSPRLGSAGQTGTKTISSGFLVQDAFGEWKFAGDAAMLDVGLFYTPQSRSALTGSSSPLTFDGPSFTQQQTGPVQGSSGRDVGLSLKGYFLSDRLEYRVGVFDGQRQPATTSGAGSRNSLRTAARVQYEVFDIEKGYVYIGTNRGSKKILAIGAWGDTQGDFRGYGADVFADIPIGKDAVTAEGDYVFYDGGREFQAIVGNVPTPVLPKVDIFFSDAGYYFHAAALQPFVRYERIAFREERFQSGDQQRYAVGFNWYVFGQNFKVTPFYERIIPKVKPAAASVKNTNHFGVQLQFYYF
jgi:Phosphate-selective porin O and P